MIALTDSLTGQMKYLKQDKNNISLIQNSLNFIIVVTELVSLSIEMYDFLLMYDYITILSYLAGAKSNRNVAVK